MRTPTIRKCSECRRLWKAYKFGLVRRHRLNTKLTAMMGAFDLPNFEELSRELTMVEAAHGFLCDQIDEHQSQTGHNPMSDPIETRAGTLPNNTPSTDVETTTLGSKGSKVQVVLQGGDDGMLTGLNVSQKVGPSLIGAKLSFCEEKRRLTDELLGAIHELNLLQNDQTQAIITGDSDFSRFDILIHIARQKKDEAKYAWMAHVEVHHCEEA